MDISEKFSLVDFLAYLFPGIVGTLGLYVLLLLTPLKPFLASLPKDITTGILLLALSYVIGVVLSGIVEIALKLRAKRKAHVWIRDTIPVPGFQQEVITAFKATFGENSDRQVEWSASHFYLCRSTVFECMPALASFIQRQSSLRQLRMNLIPATAIWSAAGIGWGIQLITNDGLAWGYTVAIGAAILWFPLVGTILNRMNRNEEREVREVLTAFLTGYRRGLFEAERSSDNQE